MDAKQQALVKADLRRHYAFDKWEPITAELLGANVLYGVYAFVEAPASIKVPHSTLFLRAGGVPKWYTLGLAWRPKGDFFKAAVVSLARSCKGVSISSPDPSSQIWKRGGPDDLPGEYISPVWAGRITSTQRDKLKALLASMTHVETGDRGSRVRTSDPLASKDFPLQRFVGKGYRIFGRNCATVVEELLQTSCLKRWYLFFTRADPKACKFDPATHPIDLSFLEEGVTPLNKLQQLQLGGHADKVLALIDSLYRDRVLRI
jgi:hypothetical protein